jgi:starvation-inducible outer membrane lipoprotein
MRSITHALIASLALAALLAGCTSTPNQSTKNTDQVDSNITVTCPDETNTSSDSNMSTNTTSCGTGTDNSTTTTNTTSGG